MPWREQKTAEVWDCWWLSAAEAPLCCVKIRQKLRTPSAIRGQHIELHVIGDEEGICADVSQIVVPWFRTIGPLSVDQRPKSQLANKFTRCTLGNVISCCIRSNDSHILIKAI